MCARKTTVTMKLAQIDFSFVDNVLWSLYNIRLAKNYVSFK